MVSQLKGRDMMVDRFAELLGIKTDEAVIRRRSTPS
jgi:hypothetical protein